jgi:hypothetical protein
MDWPGGPPLTLTSFRLPSPVKQADHASIERMCFPFVQRRRHLIEAIRMPTRFGTSTCRRGGVIVKEADVVSTNS